MLAATARGDFEMTLGGWSGLLDPDSNCLRFLHTGSALNIAKYANPNLGPAARAGQGRSRPSQAHLPSTASYGSRSKRICR